ncbi:hypothetical protein LXA43DRAFT_421839 [Ganoderma leucocontextum]|nr:hypothetical protein LXA43DRAFT_421839 [Ganoderma leucocontextum]
MLLSHLIMSLSLFFAPLASGRPASAPTHKVFHTAAPAEPNALLGRHYLVHEHREAAYTHTVSATTASHRAQQTPRHTRPFARYFADRSGDIWMHERPRAPIPILIPRAAADDEPTRKYVNYLSHVGPYAYEPPPPPPPTVTITVTSQPSPTLVEYDESPSTASVETTVPVLNLAAANATATSTSTDPYPTTETKEPSKGKKVKATARAKLHKSGKKEYKERRKY